MGMKDYVNRVFAPQRFDLLNYQDTLVFFS